MNNGIGVLIHYRKSMDIELEFKKAIDMEINSCQLCIWDESIYCDESAEAVNQALKNTGFKITAVWGGWAGPCEWNFSYGPSTIGLVPAAYRESRLNALKKASDFAEKIKAIRVEGLDFYEVCRITDQANQTLLKFGSRRTRKCYH